MRYLCIDLGDKRTGLAVGDTVTGLVSPLHVVEVPIAERAGETLLAALAREVEKQIGLGPSPSRAIVVGLPMNMDGTEGPRAKLVRAFAARIGERVSLAVEFQDERLTSDQADRLMARSGMTRGEKKSRRDALAAATILEDFLRTRGDANNPASSPDDQDS